MPNRLCTIREIMAVTLAAALSYPSAQIILPPEAAPLPASDAGMRACDADTGIHFDSILIVYPDTAIADSAIAVLSAEARADTVVIPDSTLPGPDIVVVARKRKRSEDTYRQSSVRFTPQHLKTTAGAVEDINRFIATLPSAVSPAGEGYNSALVVRGGRPDEVLYLVDGIEMENINHFSKANGSGGPIGFINTDFVDSVNYFAGTIPVRYPSRMSSIIDITMKNAMADSSRASLGGKLTGGMLTAYGPLSNGKSAYSVSGRYVDFTPLRSVIKDEGVPKLGDLFGKITMRPGEGIDLSATGLFSYNTYRYSYPIVQTTDGGVPFFNRLGEDEKITQGGAGLSARYEKGASVHNAGLAVSFRDGNSANSLESLNDTFFLRRYAANPVKEKRDSRTRITLNAGSELSLKKNHSVSLGVRAAGNEYEFSRSDKSRFNGECIFCDGDIPVSQYVRKEPVGNESRLVAMEGGLSADYTYKKKRVSASAGVRADYFRLIADAAVSPRISLSLHPRRAGVFTGSAGMYHQFPVELPSLLFDVSSSFPGLSADSIGRMEKRLLLEARPQRCWQAAFGYDKSLPRSHELKVEAYYKWYDREFRAIAPDIREIFHYRKDGSLGLAKQNGVRKAYGIETTIGNSPRRSNRFYSLAMSLFDVKNRYAGDTWYNDWTNVRYTAFLSFGSHFFSHHMATLSVQGAGGRPFCPETIYLDCIDRKVTKLDSSAAFYSRRLEKTFSVNARYAFTSRIRGIDLELSLEILNALDYKPTVEYRFNGERFVEIKPFGITPIVGCTVRM